MSLASIERISFRELLRLPRRRELATTAFQAAAIHETETPQAPAAVLDRIEEIKQQPIEDIDISLNSLIALSRDEELASDTGEIPPVLTEAIRDTAELMVEQWDDDDYNLAAVAGLTNAYAITHDHTLIEKAMDIVHSDPDFATILPEITGAVEFASEQGEKLDEHFQAITPMVNQPLIPMPPKSVSSERAGSNEQPRDQVPKEKYEYLFHPSLRRPSTPEYTSAGIHPSLGQRK